MSRHLTPRSLFSTLAVSILAASTASAQGQGVGSSLDDLLRRGRLADAGRLLGDALGARPGDDDARFALGVVQFLGAVEGRMQAFHRHGYRSGPGIMPFSNLPIPKNPGPEPLDYKAARTLLQAWIDDLAGVEATLAKVDSPGVKVPLRFGLIRLDFDGDGEADEDETLWKVYGKFNRGANASADAASGFVIAFDRGDVDWLRG